MLCVDMFVYTRRCVGGWVGGWERETEERSLTLKKEPRLRVFGNRMLKILFTLRGMKWIEKNAQKGAKIICTLHQVILRSSYQGGWVRYFVVYLVTLFSNAGYSALNEEKWMMSCKGCGRKRSWPILRHYPGLLPGGLRNNTKNLK
jgi:hypothetical protein